MKSKILIIGVLVVGLSFAGNVYAIGQNNVGQGEAAVGARESDNIIKNSELKEVNQENTNELQTENENITVTSEQIQQQTQQQAQQNLQDKNDKGLQVQNKNQIQNNGAEIQIKNQEQEGVQTQNKAGIVVSEQTRSQVANAVQEMLEIADRNGGIGEQVRVIAQSQNQNKEKLSASLQKVQDRSKFSKFFIGPNFSEINNAKKILEQNREQIKELNQTQNQLTNQGDSQKLSEQVRLLEQSYAEMEDYLDTSAKGFSLFGWVFRMFVK